MVVKVMNKDLVIIHGFHLTSFDADAVKVFEQRFQQF